MSVLARSSLRLFRASAGWRNERAAWWWSGTRARPTATRLGWSTASEEAELGRGAPGHMGRGEQRRVDVLAPWSALTCRPLPGCLPVCLTVVLSLFPSDFSDSASSRVGEFRWGVICLWSALRAHELDAVAVITTRTRCTARHHRRVAAAAPSARSADADAESDSAATPAGRPAAAGTPDRHRTRTHPRTDRRPIRVGLRLVASVRRAPIAAPDRPAAPLPVATGRRASHVPVDGGRTIGCGSC